MTRTDIVIVVAILVLAVLAEVTLLVRAWEQDHRAATISESTQP